MHQEPGSGDAGHVGRNQDGKDQPKLESPAEPLEALYADCLLQGEAAGVQFVLNIALTALEADNRPYQRKAGLQSAALRYPERDLRIDDWTRS